MRFNPAHFWTFGRSVAIPTKEEGVITIASPFGTQRVLGEAIAAGLEAGVHDFVVLKGGRQIGGSTFCDLLDLYWPLHRPGTVGLVVLDDDPNLNYRRHLLRRMYRSLPKGLRVPLGANNAELMEFQEVVRPDGSIRGGSQLLFAAAGVKSGEKLGRSKGLNYLHGDEPGFWTHQKGVAAVRAALAEDNPERLYVWIGTANGQGTVFHDMVRDAQQAVTQRFVFLAWWMHGAYSKPYTEANRELWDAYGGEPTGDEWEWMQDVERLFGHEITLPQLVWWRWALAEKMGGDRDLMDQEFGSTPERCFVAFGDKLIPTGTIRALQRGLEEAPPSHGYRHEWGPLLEDTRVHEDPDGALTVWDEPDPKGVYIIGAHPWGASEPSATAWVIEVFRAYPDRLVQIAEFHSEDSTSFHFAWLCLALAGTFRTMTTPYFIMDLAGPGLSTWREIQRVEQRGYGVAREAEQAKRFLNFSGAVRHYFYLRPDSFRANPAPQWKSQPDNRVWLMTALRDEVQRGHVEIRSRDLVDELAMLRRDADATIAAGGTSKGVRATTTAFAVEFWLHSAMNEIRQMVAPKAPPTGAAAHVGARLVGSFLAQVWSGKR